MKAIRIIPEKSKKASAREKAGRKGLVLGMYDRPLHKNPLYLQALRTKFLAHHNAKIRRKEEAERVANGRYLQVVDEESQQELAAGFD